MNRKQLYVVLDVYLEALQRRDPSRVRFWPDMRLTENNVAISVGDGLWNTLTGMGDYDLRFADTRTGQVGLFGVVEESGASSPFALRIKASDVGIGEVEMVVYRQADSALKFQPQSFEHKPVLNEVLAPRRKTARDRMVELANGYFDTLQQNDGTIHTRFHPDCQRVENGVRTTDNPDFFTPVAALGCEEQFRLGNYRYDDRLRARRYPLVDEERGLVLAAAFIDHSGALGEYELTDGRRVTSPIRFPHSFYLMELFKIAEGMIEQIEAVFITVPYRMPSPWDAVL